ncbi:hypothetical protein B1C81_27325 [Streptomyces sp. HG99]|nr:hypothetical protein B1C81_27325 [Streptomyces sp. HG99]
MQLEYRLPQQVKVQANLPKGPPRVRPENGQAGQSYQRYQDGMDDHIGALRLVPNALVLLDTRYMDGAVTRLRADGFYVRDEGMARLSSFVRQHVNVLGRTFPTSPSLPGSLCSLRCPDAVGGE